MLIKQPDVMFWVWFQVFIIIKCRDSKIILITCTYLQLSWNAALPANGGDGIYEVLLYTTHSLIVMNDQHAAEAYLPLFLPFLFFLVFLFNPILLFSLPFPLHNISLFHCLLLQIKIHKQLCQSIVEESLALCKSGYLR